MERMGCWFMGSACLMSLLVAASGRNNNDIRKAAASHPAVGDVHRDESSLTQILSRSAFDTFFPTRNPFYTYEAFLQASRMFPEFCGAGSIDERRRELAAFLAHATQETGGFAFIEEIQKDVFCDTSSGTACAPGKMYFGRGPLQLTWNFNYARAGHDLRLDLLEHPELASKDPTISFATSMWFWLTSENGIPSCHDALLHAFKPSEKDASQGRLPGFGLTLNIVNGAIVCGRGPNDATRVKITAYLKLTKALGVDPGENLDCERMKPFV